MAFNVGKFVKNQAKSAVKRIIDDIVGKSSSGLPRSSELIANSTAQSLFNIGASYESVSAFATSKTDGIVSGGDPHYAAVAGKDAAKKAGNSSAAQSRTAGSDDLNTYIDKVNPQTAIATKKANKSVEILTAIV